MTRRLVAALAAAAMTVLLAACSSGPPPAPGPRVGQRLDASLSSAVTQAALVTSAGRRVTLSSLRGKVVVLSDMMTLCQETCPLDTANVVAAARQVGRAGLGHRVVFLSVTIDPQRDTRAQLAAYRRQFAPAPADWLVAGGSRAALSGLWRALGVYIKKVPDDGTAPRNWRTGAPLTYDLTHSDEVFFVDAKGQERFLLEGAPHVAPGAAIPGRLYAFLDAKGRRNVAHPGGQAWTLPQEMSVLSWLLGRRV